MAGPRPRAAFVEALLGALRELGYVYGEHFVTEPRGGEGREERYAGLAAELAALRVDVIVAGGPTLDTVKRTVSAVPVVAAGADDPVAQGLAERLNRPGKNFTGLSNQNPEVVGKRLELLMEVATTAALIGATKSSREPGPPTFRSSSRRSTSSSSTGRPPRSSV
jgi:putative ABC transport system substrate-binding protein